MYEKDRPHASIPRSRLFAVGDIVRRRLRIDRILSSGPATDRYAVTDLETERALALKTVSRDRLGSDITLARFERELELSRRVAHPNVLTVEDAFEVQLDGVRLPVPCLLMERLDGEDLAARLGRDERVMGEEALTIAVQFAEALSAAHTAGVVHRDLKPECVMLVPQDEGTRLVLMDFGVARGTKQELLPSTTDELTATNVILGTPYYMAPELLDLDEDREAAATPASDIYSLGLILFEMVTGRAAFLGRTTIQSIFMRLDVDPPSVLSLAPDLDPVWGSVISRCLERVPARRFTDAGEIVAALRSSGQPLVAQQPHGMDTSDTSPFRMPGWMWALGVAGFLVVVGVLLLVFDVGA